MPRSLVFDHILFNISMCLVLVCVCVYLHDFAVRLHSSENLEALKKAHEEEAVENYLRNSLFGCDLQYGDKV